MNVIRNKKKLRSTYKFFMGKDRKPKLQEQSISAPENFRAALRVRSGLEFRSGAPSSAPAPGAQRSENSSGKKVKTIVLMVTIDSIDR